MSTSAQSAPVRSQPPLDYALVVGVNDYCKLRPLRGAVADAKAFAEWLMDSRGGGLPEGNVRTILSSRSPLSPVGDEIDNALENLLDLAGQHGGRRFYFYFSGHGCTGDRPHDLALCLADWSELRRRSSLGSDAWLDVILRSGVFAEIAFFLDCCRVWAVRAVGRPPKIDFAEPAERTRAPRMFLAYATEFQRPALEVKTPSAGGGQPEVRGVFTQVLIEGLRGAAADPRSGTVTAAALKQYVEIGTERLARRRGFFQRAEIMDGFGYTAHFGCTRPPATLAVSPPAADHAIAAHFGSPRSPSPSPLSSGGHESARTLALSRQAQQTIVSITAPAIDIAAAPSRLAIYFSGPAGAARTRSTHLCANWSLRGAGQTIEMGEETTRGGPGEDWRVFSARMKPGPHALRYACAPARELAVHLFPGWATLIFLHHDAGAPHFETIRVFLIPRNDSFTPDSDIAAAVDYGFFLLGSSTGEPRLPLLRAIMQGESFDDPMLGLLAAHLLARAPAPDPNRIDAIAGRVEALIGPCPDVQALQWRAALLRNAAIARKVWTDPPMLRAGLGAFIEASQGFPEVIPPRSTLEYACVERLVDSPLSSWPVRPERGEDDDDWLITTIEEMTLRGEPATMQMDPRAIARELGVPVLAVTTRLADASRRRALSAVDPLGTTEVRAPAAPPENARRKIAVVAKAPAAPAIPGYRLERVLGEGGMGRVYLARRETTGERVAVKVMLPQAAVSRESRRRFRREIDALSAVRHKKIVALVDHGEVDRTFYFAMAYHERGSLADHVHLAGLPDRDGALRIMLDVLDGLAHAHKLGYVHRDIKPQNILLDAESGALLTDFGLAKSFEEAGLSDITRSGAAAGTAGYMPREQVVNFKRVRPATDVWAAAAVLYWLLSGTTPRPVPAGAHSFLAILRRPVTPIREYLPNLPAALRDLLDRALSDEPSKRPEDAGAFQKLLRAAAAQGR